MNKIITTVLVLATGILYGQSFEGTLVYKVGYEFRISDKMTKMGVTEQAVKERMKKDGTWTDSIKTSYKQGDYITYTNFTPKSWSVYKQSANKLYTFQDGEGSDICTVTDVSVDLEAQATGVKPTVEKLDTLVEVNAMKCEVVRVKWKAGTYDYYYNSTFLKVDPKLFEGHVYDGLAEFLKISNSLPIRMVKSTKGLANVTLTLSRHSQETVDPKLFELPKLVPDKDMVKVGNMEFMKIRRK